MGAADNVKDMCREATIAKASYDNWKAKYGGMTFIRSFTLFGPQDDVAGASFGNHQMIEGVFMSIAVAKHRRIKAAVTHRNGFAPCPSMEGPLADNNNRSSTVNRLFSHRSNTEVFPVMKMIIATPADFL